jgi:dihydroorotase
MQSLSIPYPDDWHCHLRDQSVLSRTVADTAHRFRRAIVMPNLLPPITSVAAAQAYLDRIKQHIPSGNLFQPLMTLYLTNDISPTEIVAAKNSGIIFACKLYPAGATTHSDHGISLIDSIFPALETMQEIGLPLLIHGETTDPETDIFERESAFIDQVLSPLIEKFPKLRIVLEHISTQYAVDFIKQAPSHVAATITPHHLMINRNDLLVGGIHPHYYCLPIVKRASDQKALIKAVISGNPKFFLGTDSAPHTSSKKESACGCAGIYSAHAAVELYTQLFDKYDALDKLSGFASEFGAQFYRLPINTDRMTLIKKTWDVSETLAFGENTLIPFHAGKTLQWQISNEH